MAKKNSLFQWDTLLDDSEWERAESLDELLPPGAMHSPVLDNQSSPVRRLLAVVAICIVLTCTSLIWAKAQHGATAIETEVRNTIDIENWTRYTNNADMAYSIIDSEAEDAWREDYLRELEHADALVAIDASIQQVTVGDIRLRPGLALARVTISDDSGDAYRETRFYRVGTHGWERTSPATGFWGQQLLLETAHFRIMYRQADARAVITVAAQLDAVYEQLHHDLGLTSAEQPLTVVVAPIELSTLRSIVFNRGHLTVPSPLLLKIPSDISDETLLVRSITYALVVYAWNEASRDESVVEWRDSARLSWEPMQHGIQLWQAHAGCESVDSSYTNTAMWIYHDVAAIRSGERSPSTADMQLLCQSSSIWKYRAPLALSPFVLCQSPDWEQYILSLGVPPDTLDQLFQTRDWNAYPSPTHPPYEFWARSIAAATVVDYLVNAYGREQLPLLVEGFRIHDSWEALLRDVAGVSAAEFEDGWRAFLTEQYGYKESVYAGKNICLLE